MLQEFRTKIKRVAILVFCIAYVIFPLDLLPEFIPIAGIIDDLGAIYAGYRQVRAMAAAGKLNQIGGNQ